MRPCITRCSGGGGLDEVLAAFANDQVQFAGLRVTAIDRKGARTSKRAKLVYICWTGPEVKIMVKTKTMAHKATVQGFFSVRCGAVGCVSTACSRLPLAAAPPPWT
jgi:hypothetical protein